MFPAMGDIPDNEHALAWIESYARCELSLEELCQRVQDALGSAFIHNPKMRIVNLYQICPDRAVRITRQHMEILLEKRRRGEVSERQMVDWGTMVTVNACYFCEREDEEVADWISFLHLDLVPED